MMKKLHILLALLIFLVSACAGSAEPTLLPQNPPPQQTATPVPMDDLATLQTPVPEAAMPLVNIAIQDLAQRLGVGLDEITVIHYEGVNWAYASLGCPQPGMDYAQVITQGFEIVLQYQEDTYSYHSDLKELVTLCRDDTETTGFVDKIESTVKDGGPNETKDDDVIIMPPTERK